MRNIEKIKEIPIVSYLEKKGIIVPTRGNICAFWRGDKNPSVSIDRNYNKWYDHGVGYGGSIIDLVMTIENCDFAQALDLLESRAFSTENYPLPPNKKRQSAFVIDKVLSLQHPALLEYLNKRGISYEIANGFCKEVHYHLSNNPSSQFFAIGFQQKSKGWELRNPKIKLATAKDYSFFPHGGTHLSIFEGFMDFLSFLEFPESIFPKTQFDNHLVLNSVSLVDSMLKDLNEGNLGNIKSVSLYLDADDAGRKTSAFIKEYLGKKGIILSKDAVSVLEQLGPSIKDINDALIYHQQQTHNKPNTGNYEQKR